MKRLFVVNGSFFESKKEAKGARGAIKVPAKAAEPGVYGSKATPAVYEHVVSYGPDHWKRGGEVPGEFSSIGRGVPAPEKPKRTRKKAAA